MNGCCWVMTVGWPGMMVRRVTTRRTRCTVRARVTRCGRARCTTRLRILGTLRTCCTSWLREGACETWTAPPPISAPPHVQAQSFAKAIRTDISSSCPLADPAPVRPVNLHIGKAAPDRSAKTASRKLLRRWSHVANCGMDAMALTMSGVTKCLLRSGFQKFGAFCPVSERYLRRLGLSRDSLQSLAARSCSAIGAPQPTGLLS